MYSLRLSVCWFVCLSTRFHKKLQAGLAEIFREDRTILYDCYIGQTALPSGEYKKKWLYCFFLFSPGASTVLGGSLNS